jgi:hypothetical protein
LKEHNLKVLSANSEEPTLEDVYISLVGRGLEDSEAAV